MALELGNEFKAIAEQLINKYPDVFGHIDLNTLLILSETEKAPKKLGEVMKVKSPYNFITNYKYIMTIYIPNIIAMTEAQKNILVMHELMHISPEDKLVDHDLKDFFEIAATYGPNWDTNPNVKDPLA